MARGINKLTKKRKLSLLIIAVFFVGLSIMFLTDFLDPGFYYGSVSLLILGVLSITYIKLPNGLLSRLSGKARTDDLAEKIKNSFDAQFRQLEAHQSLIHYLQPRRPLPPMRGSVISPDFANILVDIILSKQPRTIVECGSGVSTLIMSYVLEKANIDGHVYSLDHEQLYKDITVQNLSHHGLEKYATVRLAELKAYQIEDSDYDWYDIEPLKDLEHIDLLVVDGPPRRQDKKMVRYPALPLLRQQMSAHATIVLDDANRDDEKKVSSTWSEMLNGEQRHIMTEKGTSIITIS